MRNSLYRQLTKRINDLPDGEVVTVIDFTDIAQPKTVSKMLTRLQEEGIICRVMRSVFWKPGEGMTNPKPNQVAEALARENQWSMAPCGKTALYLLGLTDEAPRIWTYVTDGTYRTYSYGDHKISFAHTSSRMIGKVSDKTKIFVAALKACGSKMSDETFRKMFNCVKKWNLKTVVEETKTAAVWIRKTAVKMRRLQEEEPVKIMAGNPRGNL